MNIRIPVFIQLSILIIVFAVGSSLVSLALFKNFTKEVIEDEIFSKYLRDSETITRNLEPVLKQYEDKVSICIVSKLNCDKSFIEKIDLSEEIKQRELTRIENTKYYYSEKAGDTFLAISQENQEYLISLQPLQNELMDLSVIRDDYILAINKDGIVIFNLSSPFQTKEKLAIDKDTFTKLQADITSGNFYIKDEKTGFQSMNLFHNLPYLNLKLVIGNENRFVFYELNKIEKFAWKIFFFIIPVILILSFLVSRFEKERFRKISLAIKEISSENFETRIQEGRFKKMDEIDDLILAFNFMAEKLEKFHKMNINKILEMNSKLVETNFELGQAKATADEANKAKTQFLATMTHDIRTPLNAVIGFTQIIEQGEDYQSLPEIVKSHINGIALSGKNLVELINNILDLSKIEAGKMEINEEDVNLKILMQGIYSINKSLADTKNISFSYKLDPDLPDGIIIDRTKLNQILMNLCGNAIKFTPSKKNVLIEAKKNNELIEFIIRDEGIGIPKEKHATVFEAFEQSDKSILGKFGGTGLGLSIVKKMTDLMKGSITLESDFGTGSSFFVSFPLKVSNSQEVGKEKKAKLKFEKAYKILVIDDNAMNYEILRFHLKKLGLNSFYANGGRKGLQMALELKPDIILLDIHMPEMSGVEVKKELLKDSELCSIPTVVMSADVFSDSKNEALEVAFSDFLSKPIDFNELNSILEKNLRDKTIS
ncbi:MAG: response regulator [Leptospiraceae bacterium]|nr:response regulator [Leptospiraceae bacterium]